MRPVIINGMFRSGTTLLWRILAADISFSKRLTEPLHPDLPTNIGKYGPYREYARFPEALRVWSPDFHSKLIRLKAGDDYPALKEYLSHLIVNGALIKFCRMNLRLAWFLENFRDVYVINMVRDARAVCYSYLKGNQKPIDLPGLDWSNWYGSEYFRLYSQLNEWGRYL